MAARTFGAVIGCCALALALTACGQQHPPADLRQIHPDAHLQPGAARICDPEDPRGSVPDGFEPTTVYVCDIEMLYGSPVGVGGTPAPSRSPHLPTPLQGDVSELLDALDEPNDPRWPGPCSAIGFDGPQIWLADDAGSVMHAAYPVDGCGMPKNFGRISAALEVLSQS